MIPRLDPDHSCQHLAGSPVTFHFGHQLIQGMFQGSPIDLFQLYEDQNTGRSLGLNADKLEESIILWSSPTRLYRGSQDTFVAVFDAAENATSSSGAARRNKGYKRVETTVNGWKLVDFDEEVEFMLVSFEPLHPETWESSTSLDVPRKFALTYELMNAKYLTFSNDELHFDGKMVLNVVDRKVGKVGTWHWKTMEDKAKSKPRVVDPVDGKIYDVEENSSPERWLIGVHNGQKIFRRQCLASGDRKKHELMSNVGNTPWIPRFKTPENLYCYEVESCEVAYGPRAMVFHVLVEPKRRLTTTTTTSTTTTTTTSTLKLVTNAKTAAPSSTTVPTTSEPSRTPSSTTEVLTSASDHEQIRLHQSERAKREKIKFLLTPTQGPKETTTSAPRALWHSCMEHDEDDLSTTKFFSCELVKRGSFRNGHATFGRSHGSVADKGVQFASPSNDSGCSYNP
ncbi:hypothetical protein L596_012433 [Steinernema carpocapsae]|uniref:Uncharacterized protein n=1 Tax=Steinernema carpocapsae TaxID=34508 RepID=A0A4U5NXX1_STECR|nr:hypothetical protein L596_012433 [Steinernema carpocapsae]